MIKILSPILLCALSIHLSVFSDSIAAGRVKNNYAFEVYGGYGQLNSLSGRLQETQNGSVINGGLDTDFNQLGIEDGSESMLIGGSLTGKWFTLLLDYRQNTIEASGTADSEIRLNVDSINFNGQSFEYLLIPVNSDYTLDSETNLLGLGLRFTPFTVNPTGNVRFTPWIHAGLQYIDSTFDLNSGNSASIQGAGFQGRSYVVNGRATGEAQLIIPEIGIGGELRFLFHDGEDSGPELTLFGTYKLLDLEGNLDSIGVDDDEFDRLSVTYTALELGANFYYPLGDSVDLLIGLYLEQVESNTVLESKPSVGTFQREVDLDYTLYGLRAGLRF
jgi:hypothetical protein